MAKIMQLAKDLLKGGNKEDIYPKTIDAAVYLTDGTGSELSSTLKSKLSTIDAFITSHQDNRLYIVTINSEQTEVSADILTQLKECVQNGYLIALRLQVYRDNVYTGTTYYLAMTESYIDSQNNGSFKFGNNTDSIYVQIQNSGRLIISINQ